MKKKALLGATWVGKEMGVASEQERCEQKISGFVDGEAHL